MSPTYTQQTKRTHVKIENTLYARAKAKAVEKGKTTQDYINEVLLMNLEKDEFLKSYAPNFSAKLGQTSLYVFDAKKKRSAEIIIKNNKLICLLDETNDCEHIHFALALQELGAWHSEIRKEINALYKKLDLDPPKSLGERKNEK